MKLLSVKWVMALLIEMRQGLQERNESRQFFLRRMESVESRRQDRRLKKYKKKYQVHTVSKSCSITHGALKYFYLANF